MLVVELIFDHECGRIHFFQEIHLKPSQLGQGILVHVFVDEVCIHCGGGAGNCSL